MIKIRKLCKKYNSGEKEITALNEVSLDVEDGAFVSIVGESGAGKSTLFHILAGLDNADSGSIIINGNDVLQLKKNDMTKFRRSQIGLIYQFYNLVPILTIEENIVLPKRLESEKVDKDRLQYILNKLDLSDRRHHLPNELSGGEQQRVAIGRVLYCQPSIILADEPTGNLDQKNSELIINYFKHLNIEKGLTIIIITHSLKIAKQANRVITMSDGKIIADEVNDGHSE